MSHTPGPWFYGIASDSGSGEMPISYRAKGYSDNPAIRAKNGEQIVGCDEYDIFGPWMGKNAEAERDANVRLLCSAPELLAALQQIADIENDPRANSSFEEISEARIIARAAIARATGAEPC